MLGKRPRSMHRTVSICQLDTGLDSGNNSYKPQAPVVRIVGFCPPTDNAESCLRPEQFNTFSSTMCPQFPEDRRDLSAAQEGRSPVCRISALQTLLAATRQAVDVKDNSGYSSCQLESQAVPGKLLCFEGDDGHAAIDAGSKDVKGSRSIADSHRFLYLATSPLFDMPTLTPSINFLDACYLCKRPLGHGLDIFMYRGDTAFCSVECRYQQILIDERKERSSLSRLGAGQLRHPTRWTAVAGGR